MAWSRIGSGGRHRPGARCRGREAATSPGGRNDGLVSDRVPGGRHRPGAERRGREAATAPGGRNDGLVSDQVPGGRHRPGAGRLDTLSGLGTLDRWQLPGKVRMQSEWELSMTFKRSHPAHTPPVDRHNRPTILHVTVVVRGSRPILCSESVHDALRGSWEKASQWLVGSYVIMPEHVHLFCAPGTMLPVSVRHCCGYWKRLAGQSHSALGKVWLPDCWDTQMRNAEHYRRKAEYVRENPVRRRLVAHADCWPFQGAMADLKWLWD